MRRTDKRFQGDLFSERASDLILLHPRCRQTSAEAVGGSAKGQQRSKKGQKMGGKGGSAGVLDRITTFWCSKSEIEKLKLEGEREFGFKNRGLSTEEGSVRRFARTFEMSEKHSFWDEGSRYEHGGLSSGLGGTRGCRYKAKGMQSIHRSEGQENKKRTISPGRVPEAGAFTSTGLRTCDSQLTQNVTRTKP